MIDSVIAGTGNSRYLRTSLPAGTTWNDALAMLRAGTFPIDLAGLNQAGFTTVGTALNSANLLKTAVITALGLDADATPSDAWEAALALIAEKADADSVVTALTYNPSTKKLTATINGSSVDVATFNFTTAAEAAAEAPVQSVSGKTGAVTLDAGDVSYSDNTTYTSGTVGAEVSDLKSQIENLDGISPALKAALLQLASKVVYIDDDGQTYYDDLYDALYPQAGLVSISAVYTQSGTVYDTDSLDDLKPDLVVTATYDDSSTETVTTYTLSGTLTAGTSTITVTFGGKTTTFMVTVTHNPYWVTLSIDDDFVEGTTFSSTYSPVYDGYYSSNASRCAYAGFGFVVEPGYNYTFKYDTQSTYKFGVNWWDSDCLSTAENHGNIDSFPHADSGWKTDGYVYTPTDSRVALIQFDVTKATLLLNGLTELRIIKEAV